MGIAIESFKKGFDWIHLNALYTLFAVVFVANLIPFIGSLLSALVGMAFLYPKIVSNYIKGSKYVSDPLGAFVATIIAAVFSMIASLFNWKQRNILYLQIGLFAVAVVLFLFAGLNIAAQYMSQSGVAASDLLGTAPVFILAILAMLAYGVVVIYNSIRYSQVLPLLFTATDDGQKALDMSWQMTEGKVLSLIGLNALVIALGFVISVLILAFSVVPFAVYVVGSLLTVFLTFVSYFATVNFFVALREGDGKKKSR